MQGKIIAHRGASSVCPENTLVAVKKAAELGATWVEADIQISKDGVAFMIHDFEISRTTNSNGMIGNKLASEISEIDAGAWFDKKFAGERIPTFDAFLCCLHDCHMGFNLELKHMSKSKHISPEAQEEEMQTLVRISLEGLANNKYPQGLIISSFSLPLLKKVKLIQEEFKVNYDLGYIVLNYNSKHLGEALEIGAVSMHINKETFLNINEVNARKIIDSIKAKGLDVYIYTVNKTQDAKRLFDLGIDGIFTDYPQLMS